MDEKPFMNYLGLFFLGIIFSSLSFSFVKEKNEVGGKLENAREVNLPSSEMTSSQFTIFPKSKKEIPPFNFKVFLKDQTKLEQFITANLSILELESSSEVASLLQKGSEGLVFESFFKSTPLLSEFIFEALKKPESIAKFTSFFFQFNKLLIFSFIMVSSFILSHFLGEYKFRYEPLSIQRISYGVFRFGCINLFRLGSFGVLFHDHFKLITGVFINSVSLLNNQYPVLHGLLSFL